jgi:hypothetical protein
MKNKESGAKKETPRTEEFELKSSGQITVRIEQKPAQAPKGRRIHPRRPLPLVPEAAPKGPSKGKT